MLRRRAERTNRHGCGGRRQNRRDAAAKRSAAGFSILSPRHAPLRAGRSAFVEVDPRPIAL
jgi:hypothetical protein